MSYDTGAGQPVLTNGAVATVGPFETGMGTKIVGSVASDQSGTMLVQQTFAYKPTYPGVTAPTINWDVSQSISVVAGTPATIDIDVIAPYCQIVYTNGSTTNTYLRIFARAIGNRGAA